MPGEEAEAAARREMREELRFWTREEIDDALGSGVLTPAFEDAFACLAEKE